MSAISTDERREVAARLRKAIGLHEFAEVLGFNWTDDSDWGWKDVSNLVADLIEPQPITGDTSDGYHTFDELYDHRAKLFSVIVRCFKDRAWKSKLHHDGTMYEGMFIVGVETPQGQATYHYDIDPYWDIFDCKELARAPEWDGHTPEQAISRIASLRPTCDRDALLALADEFDAQGDYIARVIDDSDGDLDRHAIDAMEEQYGYARRIREACGEGER